MPPSVFIYASYFPLHGCKWVNILCETKNVQNLKISLFCAVKHSLKYFLTATSGVPDLPELVGAAMVDEVQVGYYDSRTKTAEAKQDWMRKLIKDDPQHLKWYAQKCSNSQQVFRANINSLKQRLNQTGGTVILCFFRH